MNNLNISKVVNNLPIELVANTIYFVKKNAGFDIYITNDVGETISYALNQPMSDWNESDIGSLNYITNKPTKLSEFENDDEFLSKDKMSEIVTPIISDFTAPSHNNLYFVNKYTGSDNNNGSSHAPFATISKAVEVARCIDCNTHVNMIHVAPNTQMSRYEEDIIVDTNIALYCPSIVYVRSLTVRPMTKDQWFNNISIDGFGFMDMTFHGIATDGNLNVAYPDGFTYKNSETYRLNLIDLYGFKIDQLRIRDRVIMKNCLYGRFRGTSINNIDVINDQDYKYGNVCYGLFFIEGTYISGDLTIQNNNSTVDTIVDSTSCSINVATINENTILKMHGSCYSDKITVKSEASLMSDGSIIKELKTENGSTIEGFSTSVKQYIMEEGTINSKWCPSKVTRGRAAWKTKQTRNGEVTYSTHMGGAGMKLGITKVERVGRGKYRILKDEHHKGMNNATDGGKVDLFAYSRNYFARIYKWDYNYIYVEILDSARASKDTTGEDDWCYFEWSF